MDRRTYLGTVANKPLADLAIERLRDEGFEVIAGQPLLPYLDAVQPYEIHMLDPDCEDTAEARAKIAEILGFGEDSELTEAEASAIEAMPSEDRAEITPRRARWGCAAIITGFLVLVMLWAKVFGSPSEPHIELLQEAKRSPTYGEDHDFLRTNGLSGQTFSVEQPFSTLREQTGEELRKKGLREDMGQGFSTLWKDRPGNRGYDIFEYV